MKNNNDFITINDAYQLVEGAKLRAKKYPEELFVIDTYDADKKGYKIYPFESGLRFTNFGILITETELMYDYEIEELDVTIGKIDAEGEAEHKISA